MYAVGLLFGLGFDTATEIGLLALAGTAASHSAVSSGAVSSVPVPWWVVLTLPVLFAAGMSLLDSAQGAMSRRAYSWRSTTREGAVRRYDLLVTGVSIVVALVIGTVELSGVVLRILPHPPAVAGVVGAVDLNALGFVLTACLVVLWAGAALWFGLARVRRSAE